MQYFEKKIGNKTAKAVFYLHEPSPEIKPNRKYSTIVICPGGGYMWTSDREAEPIAMEFFAKGYDCCIVYYSTEGLAAYQKNDNLPQEPVSAFPTPLVELALSISILRENSSAWSIDPDSIYLLGFSAGGNLAGLLSVYWNEDWLKKLTKKKSSLYRPNAVILAYAVLDFTPYATTNNDDRVALAITGSKRATFEELNQVSPLNHVSKDTPPSFIWCTMQDPIVPVENSLAYATALRRKNIPFELHIYEKGKHGLALADWRTDSKKDHSQSNSQAASWINLADGWLKNL
ncbi:acetyl esterase family enzyme [Liquorilactobacillus sucicola DSM 21376 = JCM 15457]|uniref:Sugar hydrolase n=1 Tax=Liquorilactobacillus sucicola DSM 21376 = JCM 15457 TaxID=1423806 RepID=A0A023D023_9LACO|nr:alpha/beta hydrolase [Liquorilactobacillus sucicola]KRN06632.1 sugar hydrolase [Liquorilactobacillus sucicola DSM 21376 = JCM 15457]GAJ27110.1 acetyl esterase family enzyme [Liquorilactobacillus sucicola DSM 21376 = JCM 15457]